MKIIAIALALLLGACASEAQFENNLRSWVGAPEGELISQWGPPTSVYESGSTKYLTFNKQRSVNIPGVAPTYQTNCGPYGTFCTTQAIGGMSAQNIALACSTTFAVVSGKITTARYEGNDCRK